MNRYERRHQALAPKETFLRRILGSLLFGSLFIMCSLGIGMLGFHALEALPWMDAFLNAAMLLSGMGPLHVPASAGGKLFAGLYAIYCGFAVLICAAIIFAPVIHRAMHRFHLEEETDRRD